jgi:hypothetical protein
MAIVPPRLPRPLVLAILVAVGLLVGTFAVGSLVGGPRVSGGDPAGVLAGDATDEETGSPSGSGPEVVVVDPETPRGSDADSAAGVLPGAVPSSLGGRFLVAPGVEPAPGPGPGRTVRVEVEDGLPIDVDAFARFVMETLNDPRGWGADGSVSFGRTDGEADIRVLVGSPATIDALCAPLATNGRWSCGRYGHAALNAVRWVDGAPKFAEAGGDLTTYRHYLVNHEVGHLLGAQHTGCPGEGVVAPIMLQQSLGLGGCTPNGWPHP